MKQKIILIAALMTALWTACSPPEPSKAADIKILATTSIIADVVQTIGGQQIEVTVLFPPGSDPHGFAATPQDVVAITESDLIFINGLGLEDSLADFLENSSEATPIIALSEALGIAGSRDPHVWMNPMNVSQWVDRIVFELSNLDPSHSAAYQSNAEKYQAELKGFDEWAEAQMATLGAGQRVLLSDHENLSHFAEHYDFEIVGTLIPGVSTMNDPSASELAALESAINKYNLSALFVGSPGSEDLAAQFASDMGIQMITIFVESLSEPNGPAVTYLEMMRYDVRAITNALK